MSNAMEGKFPMNELICDDMIGNEMKGNDMGNKMKCNR